MSLRVCHAKVKNHREGFSDSMSSSDPDGTMLSGSSDRTRNTDTHYRVAAATTSGSFTVGTNSHLILPLFIGTDTNLV